MYPTDHSDYFCWYAFCIHLLVFCWGFSFDAHQEHLACRLLLYVSFLVKWIAKNFLLFKFWDNLTISVRSYLNIWIQQQTHLLLMGAFKSYFILLSQFHYWLICLGFLFLCGQVSVKCCLSLFSVAVIKTMTKSHLGGKSFIWF